MGGRGDRPAAQRARTDSAPEPAGSGPGAAAAQRPAAGPGLEDALHGAPGLLAALAMPGEAQPGPRCILRLVGKSCCEAVDSAAGSLRVGFGMGGQAWVDAVVRRMGKLPRLAGVKFCDPSGVELEQLLATAAAWQPSAVAGVQRLEVCRTSADADMFGPGLPALLRSLAHLPSLQVGPVADTRGWACSWCFACACA
jgi:hypothetical protein